jgi:colicin import membrane protein
MPRKLKTYQTSQGFFDLAIAVPSMKAALKAWGSNLNLFHKGLAREADDPDVVAAALAKPGVVLQRPVGTNEPFVEHAHLPKKLPSADTRRDKPVKRLKTKKPRAVKTTIKRRARRHLPTRGSGSDRSARSKGKRLRGPRNMRSASARLTRRRHSSMRPGVSMSR